MIVAFGLTITLGFFACLKSYPLLKLFFLKKEKKKAPSLFMETLIVKLKKCIEIFTFQEKKYSEETLAFYCIFITNF